MMQGLTGLVRSQQILWLTSAQRHKLAVTTGLPIDDGSNACPPVDNTRCQALDCGKWEQVPALPEVTMMHAALLPGTEKVLYWGHGDLNGPVPNQSRIWDYSTPSGAYTMPPNQPHDVAINPADRYTWDIWSASMLSSIRLKEHCWCMAASLTSTRSSLILRLSNGRVSLRQRKTAFTPRR